MHVPDKHKAGRRAALSNLMTKLKGMNSNKLAGLKKASVAPGEGSDAEEAMESPEQETAEGGPEGGFCPHCGSAR